MKQPLAADDVDGSPGGDEEPESAILRRYLEYSSSYLSDVSFCSVASQVW